MSRTRCGVSSGLSMWWVQGPGPAHRTGRAGWDQRPSTGKAGGELSTTGSGLPSAPVRDPRGECALPRCRGRRLPTRAQRPQGLPRSVCLNGARVHGSSSFSVKGRVQARGDPGPRFGAAPGTKPGRRLQVAAPSQTRRRRPKRALPGIPATHRRSPRRGTASGTGEAGGQT